MEVCHPLLVPIGVTDFFTTSRPLGLKRSKSGIVDFSHLLLLHQTVELSVQSLEYDFDNLRWVIRGRFLPSFPYNLSTWLAISIYISTKTPPYDQYFNLLFQISTVIGHMSHILVELTISVTVCSLISLHST